MRNHAKERSTDQQVGNLVVHGLLSCDLGSQKVKGSSNAIYALLNIAAKPPTLFH